MTEIKKCIMRFGGLGIVSLILLTLLAGLLSDKVRMVLLGVALSEVIWMCLFKPVYGKTEDMADGKMLAVLLFRGIYTAAIILGLTIGM
jgi:hypothetical protein